MSDEDRDEHAGLPVPAPRAGDEFELDLARERRELLHAWSDAPGLLGRLATLDHKVIAKRYIITAFVFFGLGGIAALVMRAQLATPEAGLVGPDLYNQLFSVHGTTMMFLFAVPVMEAVGLYFVPLMVGARNVAFPRLNAFGYFVYLIGGVLLWVGFLLNTGPEAGWFNYVPLAGPEFSAGKRIDVWAQTVTFTEIAALVVAIEIIVTVFKQRAPGMTLDRIPLFVWAMLVTSFMVLFAMPTIAMGSIMLALDRLVGTHFFNPAEGGDPLLWQHLFWFFGHPEVYIIFLPAAGMVSAMLPTLTGRPVFGYPAIVLSLIATGFIGFGLWVHHMFATGIAALASSAFTAASLMIVIPNGVQVFCWLATIWTGRLKLTTPMLYILAFIVLFVMGGVTGVMVASVPLDEQLHDTFFVVAHFHYVLIGGALFPLFGAIYHWFPKLTGKLLSDRLGKVNFWLLFVGFNVTFFPLHIVGVQGMPRRVHTYLEGTGWGTINLISSAGAVVIVAAVVVFVWNVATSLRRGVVAGDDPWGADSLEWLTTSPPPPYNFAPIPVVEGRSPAWERTAESPVVTGLRVDRREILVTTVLDAHPDYRHRHPEPTLAPLCTALATGVFFVGSIFTPWAAVIGAVLLTPALIAWGWPERPRFLKPKAA